MPEPQRGVGRWVVLALVLAVVITKALAGTDDTDHSMSPWQVARSWT